MTTHVGPVDEAQGGPPDDHRARQLHRRHQPPRDAARSWWCARQRRTPRSPRSTRRPPRSAPAWSAVFTGEDMAGDFAGPIPMVWAPPGVEVNNPEHWPLARGAVKHVGDPVAVVIGEDRYAVVDAAEDVIVEYESLPAIVDPEAALEEGSPLVWEQFGTNKTHEWAVAGGDIDAGARRGRGHGGAARRSTTARRRRADRAARLGGRAARRARDAVLHHPDPAHRPLRAARGCSASPRTSCAWSRPTWAAASARS